MKKTFKKRTSNFVKSTSKNVKKALPIVNNSLKTAAFVAKGVAKETIPIVEKGVSAVYGTMATGFNLGVSGVKNIKKGIKSNTTTKHKRGGSRRRRSSRRRKH